MKCRGRNRRKPLGFHLVAIGLRIRHRLQPSVPIGRPSQTERAPAHGVRLLLRGREQMPSPSVTMCGGGTDSRSRWGLRVGHKTISSSFDKAIRSNTGEDGLFTNGTATYSDDSEYMAVLDYNINVRYRKTYDLFPIYLRRSLMMPLRFSAAHPTRALRWGVSVRARSVNSYSTRGGTSA